MDAGFTCHGGTIQKEYQNIRPDPYPCTCVSVGTWAAISNLREHIFDDCFQLREMVFADIKNDFMINFFIMVGYNVP